MKKIIAMMLSVMMILSMGIGVFADNTADPALITDVFLKEKIEDDEGDTSHAGELSYYINCNIATTTANLTGKKPVVELLCDDTVLVKATANAGLVASDKGINTVKFCISDNSTSDSWTQEAVALTDEAVPNKIKLYDEVGNLLDTWTGTVGIHSSVKNLPEDATFAEAWAAIPGTQGAYSQNQNANFNKTYTVNNGTSPAETFTFGFTFKDYFYDADGDGDNDGTTPKNVPTINNVTTSFNALTTNTTNTVLVNLSSYSFPDIGVYTYEVKEIKPTTLTAGVTYDETPMYLVVTVLHDENHNNYYVAAVHYEDVNGLKIGEIENQYDAGTLSITKEITGNMADMNKKFAFTVVFTPAEGTAFNIGDDGVQIKDGTSGGAVDYVATANNDGTYTVTFKLANDATATIINIPAGTTYTITEEAEGYVQTTKASAVEGTEMADNEIEANDNDAIVYVNTLDSNVDTGISVDSIPYIAMLGVVALGGTGLVISKKRRSED